MNEESKVKIRREETYPVFYKYQAETKQDYTDLLVFMIEELNEVVRFAFSNCHHAKARLRTYKRSPHFGEDTGEYQKTLGEIEAFDLIQRHVIDSLCSLPLPLRIIDNKLCEMKENLWERYK